MAVVVHGVPAGPVPLERAHAHNDYRHARPLLDALELGFCSVEADIHLVQGKLLVAHDAREVDETRTLERLYLEPLRERAASNNGRIFEQGPAVTLLIDIKTEAEPTYAVLRETLVDYEDILTHFTDQATEERAVTVLISGDCPREAILGDSPRLSAIDGRLRDLGGALNGHQVPLISGNWRDTFAWLGKDVMPEEEVKKLRDIVEKAHAAGQRVRFWGLPARPAVWPVLYEAGVDLINADDLQGLHDFLVGQPSSATVKAGG
ncbi:MAG: hypothetical protein HYV26_23715 [Candidatus Hydrogenedentes bacterium]|nr:hypothetical protein [Candidatus Hydrogenedentota bacterium]